MTAASLQDMVGRLAARYSGERAHPQACHHRVPVAHYADPQHFSREQDKVFRSRPLVLAHETQLPQPGDALVQDWLGLPLVTVRGKDGVIRSFLNVCRHRGMRLVQDQGNACLRAFVCPYHQWTYGLDGALRNVPRAESFSDLKLDERALVPVPTTVRKGLVWIVAAPGATVDFDHYLAGLDEDFDFFRLGQFHFCQQSQRSVNANWKLIQDAFLDGYHVTRLHKNTVGPFFPDAIADTDAVGEHLCNGVARNEISEAVGVDPASLPDIRRQVTFSYTLFPNAVLVFQPDYTSIISLFPQAVDRTLFVHTMLVPEAPSTDERRDHFRRSFELIDEGVFASEDCWVAEGAQPGLTSGVNETLSFGALEEAAIRFHQTLEQVLAD